VTREELVALRYVIDLTLALPDSIREMLAQWLAPAIAKPNGHGPHLPVPLLTSRPATRVKAKAKYDNPAHARTAERRLLAAMREHPGLSAASLAKVVGAGLSATKERLRRMGALISKAVARLSRSGTTMRK
jgi:hypothetical protein